MDLALHRLTAWPLSARRLAARQLAVRCLAVATATATLGLLTALEATGSSAAEELKPCSDLQQPRTDTDPITWAQQRFSLPRLQAIGTGTGQTVALIGMEVDAGNSQLSAATAPLVRVGKDPSPRRTDCSGIGTFLAGLVAARPDPTGSTPVAGLAPGVRLLPIAIGDAPAKQQAIPTPAQLAQAIDDAVAADATVICVVMAATEDSAALKAAVRRALAAEVVVVAAGVADPGAGQVPGPTYPTAYPEVLSVVGVDELDQPVTGSDHGSYTDIAGPATRIMSTGPVEPGYAGFSHIGLQSSPTAGAAYVAATVALVREAYPAASGAEVTGRILATADVVPRRGDIAAGEPWGMVDPYRALTEILSTRGDAVVQQPQQIVPLRVPDGVSTQARLHAVGIVTGSIGATAAVLALTAAGRRGRRRRSARQS